MSYKDLRDWIDQAEKMGELIHLNGVDWNVEIGVLADVSKKAILFNDIKDYPKGYRVLTGQSESKALSELTYGFPRPQGSHTDLVNFWRKWLKGARPVPTKVVRDGAVMENVHGIDDDPKSLNLLDFPVPKWHEGDGGRYIGTAGCCILRDPDENWINMGIFRIMVSDPHTMTLYICQGKNSHIIIEKAFRRGQNVPVVVLAGQDPAVWAAGTWGVWGESDLEYAGYIKGEPIEVIEGPLTGLPIPATAEIAIEGELRPGDLVTEGPNGEWTGFSEPWPVSAIRVKAIYHRNDPVHTGTNKVLSTGQNWSNRYWTSGVSSSRMCTRITVSSK